MFFQVPFKSMEVSKCNLEIINTTCEVKSGELART